MCGIFGYVNWKVARSTEDILRFMVNGLKRLEYRGYDSSGVCVDGPDGKPVICRKEGNVQKLHDALIRDNCEGLDFASVKEAHSSIAHTRWATHGEPCDRNAHPQASANKEFVLVHNGIMTNFSETKRFLVDKGFKFTSDTDTEVIAVLTKYLYDARAGISFVHLIMEVMDVVEGAYAMVFKSVHFPGEVVACKKGSPLIVGVKRERDLEGSFHPELDDDSNLPTEVFLASDSSALAEHTDRAAHLDDDDVIHIQDGKIQFYNKHRSKDFEKLRSELREMIELEVEVENLSKGRYDHFMQKEISEQPQTVMNSMRGRLNFESGQISLGGFKDKIRTLRTARRLLFISCGTSLNACLAVRPLFDELAHIPVSVENASDFLDRTPAIFRDDVCIFVSQSGETADTLRAMEYVEERGALMCGFTNTVGSTISHKTHFGAHLNAGPEIGVASTKAFTSQIVCMTLVALLMSEDQMSLVNRRKEIVDGLSSLSGTIGSCLPRLDGEMKSLAAKLKDAKSVLVLGRGYQLATAFEAALKIKELTYIHTEGLNSGELKHGPLALIDENSHIIIICTKDKLIDKSRSALQQIRARKGKAIAIVSEDDAEISAAAELVIKVPQVCDCLQTVINVLPMQLLSYHLAVIRGNNVDCPRNLAKSVTTQ